MIEEQARVIDSQDGIALVETLRQSACGQCSANKGCGTATLSKALGQKRTQLKVVDSVGSRPGDLVILGLDESALLQGSALLYLTPILSMLVSASMVTAIGIDQEWVAVVAGLLGLLLGMVFLWRYLRPKEKEARYQPVILRRLESAGPERNGVFPA